MVRCPVPIKSRCGSGVCGGVGNVESACYVVREETHAIAAAPRSTAPHSSSIVGTEASALGEQREASSKATHGRAALLRGRYQEAERLLTEALASGAFPVPTQIAALGNRGIARWRLSNPHEAIDDFNAALKLSPEESMIYNNRGDVLIELRHYAEAIKDFTQGIALAPGYGQAYNNRGNARFSAILPGPSPTTPRP